MGLSRAVRRLKAKMLHPWFIEKCGYLHRTEAYVHLDWMDRYNEFYVKQFNKKIIRDNVYQMAFKPFRKKI
jgi:hypothetical protein